jgi:hypothetical protein
MASLFISCLASVCFVPLWLEKSGSFYIESDRAGKKPDFLGKKPGNKLNQPSEIVVQPKRE